MSQDTPELTDRQWEVVDQLPARTSEIAEALDIAPTTVEDHRNALKEHGIPLEYDPDSKEWYIDGSPGWYAAATNETRDDQDDAELPDLSDVEADPDAEADPSDLSDRERVLVSELQTGTTLNELEAEIGERRPIVTEHLRDLRRRGWHVYVDETAGYIGIEGDEPLRSSEHKGTRTRKANRWWELTHNALVRRERELEPPRVDPDATPDAEDWVTHVTDLHAGDVVRGYDDEQIIHDTEAVPGLVDYITDQSLRLKEKHGSEYDTAYLLWGGDMVTNEAIYEGQHEDLDAWLDEQVDVVMDPLIRQVKAFAADFDTVRVVCQAGNHGDMRASGSSKQANADLILYKAIRNTIAELQKEGLYENVGFKIGRAGSPTVFHLRDGAIHGQLRHGQDRSPQFDTSARQKEWLSTIMDSLNLGTMVDMVWMGHHHVSGRLPWNGPPVFITGSPKPGGEYPRKLGVLTGPQKQKVATAHGVSDEGLTGVFPIDTRKYDT